MMSQSHSSSLGTRGISNRQTKRDTSDTYLINGREGVERKRRGGGKRKGREKKCNLLFHRKWEVGSVGHRYFVFGSGVETCTEAA